MISAAPPRAHELDELGRIAPPHVNRLAMAGAQLDHGKLVVAGDRAPARAVVLPALEIGDRDRGAHRPQAAAEAGFTRAQSAISREP